MTKLSVENRNNKVKKILDDLHKKALDKKFRIDESEYKESLDKLFTTTTWGYREILLVVIVAMKIDSSYRASTELYECKPRAIFEGPIKDFLINNSIPHRQSGPLNIAKATQGLNETWATQRQPRDIAYEVVKLIKYIEEKEATSSMLRIDNVGVSLLRRFLLASEKIKSLAVKINPNSNPEFLYNIICALITEVPDAGNTPQKIVAFLLKNYHSSRNTGIIVTGTDDRASVTSTTSKKPGDINEESADGYIYKVYEITVKPFDISRIHDSYNCVSIYNSKNSSNIHEIIVICRKSDCPTIIEKSNLHSYFGNYFYKGLNYYYLDIFEWIAHIIHLLTDNGRLGFYNDLAEYIDNINTAEKVKECWKKLHI